ncbi:peptidylprolyl isomerase [[Phormidium] sp. ETS-05]|uniref:peptidylprolyl isomerase n=1 Tax=[Phormidium] sp. ETS-05 TaxID=222819 RepID=UPI0018EF18F8|nr:peptidylprolyl isomerase [[Phormidium] sp. ETS-05]
MEVKIGRWLVSVIIVSCLLVGGCVSQQAVSSDSAAQSAPSSPANQPKDMQANNLPRLEGQATVVLVVKGKSITLEVDGTNAPITAGNFVDLVQRGLYNGLVFHRVVRDPQPFVVQGGDPQSKDPNFPAARLGTGGFVDPQSGDRRYIPLEIKPEGAEAPVYSKTLEMAGITKPPVLRHTRGALAMARSQAPDSASSQFYIALAELGFLDGNYAVFGYVTDGMDAVDGIKQGDRIDSAQVIKGLENLKLGGS